jgi:hypothetical protein
VKLCPACGAQNADDRAACFACQGDLSAPAPFGPPPGYVQLHSVDEVDEQFLSEFSWGSGCQYYFFSRALFVFLILFVVIFVISAVLNESAKFIDEASPLDALSMLIADLVLVAGSIWLMVRAGKVARRRRWTMLKWRDFDSFRRSELMWRRLGMIGYAANVLAIVRELFFKGQ